MKATRQPDRMSMTVSPKARLSREMDRRHYDTLFLGGGPAVLGLLAHAAKHNRLSELLAGRGIAILEAGPYFGSGALADYLIRSNTSADSFLRVTYKRGGVKKPQQEESKAAPSSGSNTFRGLSTSPEPQLASAPSGREVHVVAPFKDLYISELGRCMRQIGKDQASLSLIGYFLSFVGNHLLSYIYHTYKQKVFFPYHRVLHLTQQANGDYIATVQRTVLGQARTLQFTARTVVMGIGGEQKIPESLDYKLGIPRARLILGQQVLKKQGFIKLLQKIESEKPRNIVIVGGSHTGFSVAWLLLHGPVDYSNSLLKDKASSHFYKSSGPFNMQPGSPITTTTSYSRGSVQVPSGGLKRCPPQDCGVNGPDCFGKVREPPPCERGVHYKALPQFSPGQIKILHRNPIRVYYSELKEAKHQNYEEYPAQLYKNEKTTVYPFSGLRGDAKKLYLNIKKGREERVRLVHIANASAQKAFLNSADIVIWACGFGTKESFHFYDDKQKKTSLNREPWLVNAHCEMLKGNGDGPSQPFGNLYGVGLGYSYLLWEGEWDREKRQRALAMRSGQLWRNLNVKADSFSYYMTSIAERLFSRILQKKPEPKAQTRQLSLTTTVTKRKPTLAETVKPLNKQASVHNLSRKALAEEQKRGGPILDGSAHSINRHTSSSLKKVTEERSKSEHNPSQARRSKGSINLQNSPYEKGPLDSSSKSGKTAQRRIGEQIVHSTGESPEKRGVVEHSLKKPVLGADARQQTPVRSKNESAVAVGQSAIMGSSQLHDLDAQKIKLKADYLPVTKDDLLTPNRAPVVGKIERTPMKTLKTLEDEKGNLPIKTLFYGNATRSGNVSLVEQSASSAHLKTHSRGSGSAHVVGSPARQQMGSSRAFMMEKEAAAAAGGGGGSFTKDSPQRQTGFSQSAIIVTKKTPGGGGGRSVAVGGLHRGGGVGSKKQPGVGAGKILFTEGYRREGQYLGLIGQKLG